ncbi:LCP family protein, partial [Mediterraneibacter sp. NSJ-55]
EALAFARERYSFEDGDYQRAKNQMEVIRAVIQKCASSSLPANYSSVMDAVAGSFETNMPQDQIAALVRMQLSDMAQWNITSYTVSGKSMYAQTYSMPGQDLYVIEPDQATIEEAKRLVSETMGSKAQE